MSLLMSDSMVQVWDWARISKLLGTSTTKSLWYSESSKVFSSSSERLK
jgi:hypothetical protein